MYKCLCAKNVCDKFEWLLDDMMQSVICKKKGQAAQKEAKGYQNQPYTLVCTLVKQPRRSAQYWGPGVKELVAKGEQWPHPIG